MRPLVVSLVVVLSAVAAEPQQKPTCEPQLKPVSLRLDGRFAVRGRPHLPSGTSEWLPETISAPKGKFPLLVEATGVVDPSDLRSFIDNHLHEAGALVFRGLPVKTPDHFSQLTADLGFGQLVLAGGGTARSVVARGVRSASDEPPEHTIEPHQDMAHNPEAPAILAFLMLQGPPAHSGGETVLTDMRAVTREAIRAGIVREFEAHGGVRYSKVLWSRDSSAGQNTTFTWQRRFFTEDKAHVEACLAALPSDRGPTTWQWGAEDELFYQSVLPACVVHNRTLESVFFNGIHTNHRDYFDLAPHIDTANGSPYDTAFGDGRPIPGDLLAQIRGLWWRNSVALALESGDVAFVDNVLAGHGRLAWDPTVPRRMLIAHLA